MKGILKNGGMGLASVPGSSVSASRWMHGVYMFAACCCMAACLFSCTEETLTDSWTEEGEEDLYPCELSLNAPQVTVVGTPLAADADSRSASDTEVMEQRVSNLWVFQFSKDGSRQLGKPKYYTLAAPDSETKTVSLLLRPATDCQLYLVANTNNPGWEVATKQMSKAELDQQSLTYSNEDAVYGNGAGNLPMVGLLTDVDVVAGKANTLPTASLTHLLARIDFQYEFKAGVADKSVVKGITIANVPDKVVLGHAFVNPSAPYPAPGDLTQAGYKSVAEPQAKSIYTWYVPQNLQGTVKNTDETQKNRYATDNALYLTLDVESSADGGSYSYIIYPGKDVTSDFNIEHGYRYNVRMSIQSDKLDERVKVTPANCFVMKTNAQLMFDAYFRKETGGGWKYSNYVNKADPAKTIASVEVLWQTGDGNRFALTKTKGVSPVSIDKDGYIHVQTGDAEGNAVIAGKNRDGVILWSWHIWVNNDSPARLDKAIPYTTYQWENERVRTDLPRVKGKPVMSRNLGALRDEPGDTPTQTYGLWYQWGRKDPFPNGREEHHQDSYNYITENIIPIYNQAGTQIQLHAPSTSSDVIQVLQTDATKGTIGYVLKHPTHFLMGTVSSGDYDWCIPHNDRLWGGKPTSESTKQITLDENILYDAGATSKSLFDPCPAGWMLAPADMWLGFTKTGLNKDDGVYEDLNCIEDNKNENIKHRGYHMYMDGAKWDDSGVEGLHVSFFPSQGTWTGNNGMPMRNGVCGNYHTSTPGVGGNVAIFHLHTPGWIRILEPLGVYTIRSTAGPVRCIRE